MIDIHGKSLSKRIMNPGGNHIGPKRTAKRKKAPAGHPIKRMEKNAAVAAKRFMAGSDTSGKGTLAARKSPPPGVPRPFPIRA
jgi:hypothetical protein